MPLPRRRPSQQHPSDPPPTTRTTPAHRVTITTPATHLSPPATTIPQTATIEDHRSTSNTTNTTTTSDPATFSDPDPDPDPEAPPSDPLPTSHPAPTSQSSPNGAPTAGPTETETETDADPTSTMHPLREISSLASWTVSTYKPGCGVPALRHPSPLYFWQSDGPQPHLLNIHFFKLVEIVKLRVYLDFELDESYTPTKMVFLAGMGAYDLTEFGTWEGEGPRGWVEVSLSGVGGGWVVESEGGRREERRGGVRGLWGFGDGGEEEGGGGGVKRRTGDVLRAMLVQVRVCENHQNGKDTHVRGLQIFARDEVDGRGDEGGDGRAAVGLRRGLSDRRKSALGKVAKGGGLGSLEEPEWMREPELR